MAGVAVTEIIAVCPRCGFPHEEIGVTEDDCGSFYVDGPARFPLCEECGGQFEIPEFSLLRGKS